MWEVPQATGTQEAAGGGRSSPSFGVNERISLPSRPAQVPAQPRPGRAPQSCVYPVLLRTRLSRRTPLQAVCRTLRSHRCYGQLRRRHCLRRLGRLEGERVVVEIAQGVPVADADVRETPRAQRLVQPRLVLEVEGGGALVEEDERWRREEDACKREALLLPEGEPCGPIGEHVEGRAVVGRPAALDDVLQADLQSRRCEFTV